MILAKTGWLLTALAALLAYVLTPEVGSSSAALTGPSFPDALLALGTLIQVAISWWILILVALASMTSSSRLVRWFAPVAIRRALFVGAAGVLVISPAHAEPAPQPAAPHAVAGLQLPDRPSGAAARTASEPVRASKPPAIPAPTSITVEAGDSLWSIAARSLPPDASMAQIATATQRWHHANRAVIGADPDVLFPGQQLTSPPGKDLS